ncbi:restriction endonuclease subunit S [Providencia rettgeri]|uniref:restriction endonuclease subunit S n=1 Tax=Providencia TaxID=586 RepID=UPI0032DAD4E4
MEQVLYKLPEGWEWTNLTDVCTPSRKTVEPNPEEQYNYIGLENIESHTGRVIGDAPIKGSEISSTKVLFKQGMVLYGKLRPYLNKVIVAKVDGIATTEIIPFECSDVISPDFLAYYLRSQYFVDLAMNNCSGARMPRATTKLFTQIAKVPVTSIAEQKRIVTKLDALFTRIDTTIEHLQTNITLADALYASVLDKEFSKLMKESDIFPFKKLVDNQDGRRIPIKAGERKNTHGTYPYYGATGVIDYVDDFIFEGERLLISEDGANLVARKYPIAFIADGKYWVNNHAHVVNALPDLTSNLYLKKFFAWVDLSSYITGSAQPKLSQGKLNTIPVPVPPMSEQTEIVAELDKAYQLTENLKKGVGEKLGMLTSLKASILDSAFKGEL